MRAYDSAVREGDVEGMHRMRATTRRLRSELRLFEDHIDPEWATPLEADLKWLASKLGVVREFDILRARFQSAAGSLEESLAPIFRSVGERRARAALELQCVLDGERYEDLLHRLEAIITYPAFEDTAEEPCRRVVPQLVASTWKRLKKKARRLDDSSPDPAFHEVRKRAKRARYTAEAVADALPSSRQDDAHQFAKQATEIQDILGEHQDAADTMRFIEEIASENQENGAFNLAAGRLLERENQVLIEQRARFFQVWNQFDRAKNRRWFQA